MFKKKLGQVYVYHSVAFSLLGMHNSSNFDPNQDFGFPLLNEYDWVIQKMHRLPVEAEADQMFPK